jgi:choline dehydrogenase-like flavoprotein
MEKMFDYIVVGAGSAGAVMASRLSEDPSVSVLLLEAGPPDRSLWIHLPIGYGKTMWDKTVNWCFHTEPEPTMNGRRIYWPRGKTLGGSSSINGLIYIRGQREDYDRWAALGNPGWGYDDVLPYFIRSERNQLGADDWHGAERRAVELTMPRLDERQRKLGRRPSGSPEAAAIYAVGTKATGSQKLTHEYVRRKYRLALSAAGHP